MVRTLRYSFLYLGVKKFFEVIVNLLSGFGVLVFRL